MKSARRFEWFLPTKRDVVCASAKSKWKHVNKLWQNMMPCLCTLLGELPNCLCPLITLKLELKDVVVVVVPRVPQSLKSPPSFNSSSFNQDVLWSLCLFLHTHIHCSLTCLYDLSTQFLVMYCKLTPKTSRGLCISSWYDGNTSVTFSFLFFEGDLLNACKRLGVTHAASCTGCTRACHRPGGYMWHCCGVSTTP